MHLTRYEQVLVITVRGELDYDDAEDIEAAFDEADQAALPTTAVDLSQVTFADSTLLNALLNTLRRHETSGRDLVLLGPLQPAVNRVLAVSGTLGHFTTASTGPTPTS
ncbi:STAS domain-containing protein [Streptomyces sp. NPDC096198]|uniref:STAS domain-containing protein n=1 Tax=Streptomyces sp. NPDC096198 TaxID=3366080 RepID=UPI00382E28B0